MVFGYERTAKICVHWNDATAAVLSCIVVELKGEADVAAWVENHVPRQVCNLACTQTSLG